MASAQELLDRLELFGIRLGLENTRRLLADLGEPERRLAVVLVAGTNGKGSTAALLSAIACAAGYRTGLYTSPHLESVHERIRVDGASISEADLSARLTEVVSAAERTADGAATYFEALTVAALLHFARSGVELALLEVGLGGRLDATNATEPVLSLITEIALDHREHLGESIVEIAAEKAGILRPAVPALAWVGDPEARGAVERLAAERGVPLRFVDDRVSITRLADRRTVELATASETHRLEPALAGDHQLSNLALAVAAAQTLRATGWERFDAGAVRAGVAGCRWPGRLEWVDLGAAGRVLLDGAHNPHGAAALARHLATLDPGHTLLFGALRSKDVAAMLPLLAERAGRIVLTAPEHAGAFEPRELAHRLAGRHAEVCLPATQALKEALRGSEPVIVCGSLYLVGEVRAELTRRFGVPTAAAELPTWAAGLPAGSTR